MTPSNFMKYINKSIFKKIIITIITFFLLWIIISAYFIPVITSLSLNTSNAVWYDVYHIILYFVFGFSFGLIGKNNGWILCVLFDFVIITFYLFLFNFTDVLQQEVFNVGFDVYIFNILYFNIFYLLYLFSGYIFFMITYYLYKKKAY